MTARAYRPVAVLAIAALGLGALSAPSAADVPAQDETPSTSTTEETESTEPTTEPPPPEPDPTPTPKPTRTPQPSDAPPDKSPADKTSPPAEGSSPGDSPGDSSADDSAEASVPKATKRTAKEALAPGLSAPPEAELDLVPAIVAEPPADNDDLKQSRGDVDASNDALRAAEQALGSAEEQLELARKRLEAAVQAKDAAQRVHDEAARESAKAAVEVQQAKRELRLRVDEIDGHQQKLGAFAREAYRGGGSLSSLAVVLESTTPAEFAASLRGVEAVLRGEDVVLAGLAAELADLAEAEARLVTAQEQRQVAQDAAAAALDLATQAAQSAELVAAETEALVQQRTEALNQAQTAYAEDVAQYRSMLSASQAVESSLAGWSSSVDAVVGAPATGTMIRPATGSLTSAFGPRLHPILGYVKLHTGSDYGIGDGAIYAADHGTVVLAGYNSAYGNMTVISHGRIGGSDVTTLYAHQSRILVSPGDTVRKAELIGIIGSTGYSTGPHLHFEIRVDGTPVDPEAWLAGALTPDEYIGSDQAAADAKRRDDAA